MRRTYSYSKREALESCARRYFYTYYASAKAVPFDAERKQLVNSLKTLTNRHMLAGNILHGLIELRLKRGQEWAASWFTRTATERFDKAVAYSRNPAAFLPGNGFRPSLLGEFAYEEEDAEQLVADARDRLLSAMQEFLHNSAIVSVYAPIVAGAHRVEAKLSGLKIADFGVDGKVDLVGHSDTGVDIVDWKMGQADTFDDSLQLFAYGLWASREFNEPSERIRARKVYLGGPTVGEMTVLDDGLMRRGKARMVQDIELMKDLDRYGREGNEEAFTPCERPNMCRQCSFRGTCSAGLPLTKSRPTFAWSPAPQLVD